MMVEDARGRLWRGRQQPAVRRARRRARRPRALPPRAVLRARPEVRRVVFIATPHRGSVLAPRAARAAGQRLVRLPDPVVHAHKAAPREQLDGLLQAPLPGDGPDERRPAHLGISPPHGHRPRGRRPVGAAPLDRRRPARTRPSQAGATAWSPTPARHLEGARSELLVSTVHYCLEHPAVIREVGRILAEHLAQGRRD